MDKRCVFLSKTRTFLSDPKLLNGSVCILGKPLWYFALGNTHFCNSTHENNDHVEFPLWYKWYWILCSGPILRWNCIISLWFVNNIKVNHQKHNLRATSDFAMQIHTWHKSNIEVRVFLCDQSLAEERNGQDNWYQTFSCVHVSVPSVTNTLHHLDQIPSEEDGWVTNSSQV
jgi:hypothetical protein